MGRIYHWLAALFKRKRRLSIAEFERSMDADTRARLEREIEFLKKQHVSVRPLVAGEEASKPVPANVSDEARLPPLKVQE